MTEDEHQKVLIFFCNCKSILHLVTESSSSIYFNHIASLHFHLQFLCSLNKVMQVLGEQLKLRQQVIATAIVYFKRFYSRNSLKCVDPLLLAPTAIFLASKVEEFGVISNSRLVNTCHLVGKLIN